MITKYIIAIIAVLAFGGGSFFGAKVLTKKCPDCNPKISCPPPEKCPPCNGIDFDKIKSKALTIQNHQYLTVNADSSFDVTIRKVIQEEISRAKIARCK